MTLLRTRRELVWMTAGAALLIGSIWVSRRMVIDDSFITYRFARNIAEGHGPVWNIGGERTEGFTSVLHVLICAGGIRLGIDPFTLTRTLSILSLILCAVMARDLLARLSPLPLLFEPWIWVLLLGNALLVNAALFGLETLIFAVLITWIAWSWCRWFQTGSSIWLFTFGIASVLSVTCRPEGVVWVASLLGGTLLMQVKVGSGEIRSRRTIGAAVVALFVLVAAAAFMYVKYLYFGRHLPNPYYIKAGVLLPVKGVLYVGMFVVWSLPLWAGTLWGLFRVREPVYAGLAGACVLIAAYYLHVLPIMGTSFRFLQPLWPILCVCGVIGLSGLTAGPAKPVSSTGRRYPIASAILVVWAIAWLSVSVIQIHRLQYHIQLLDAYQRVAAVCGEARIVPVPTIAAEDQGIFPYRSGWNALDFVGLTTNQVAWSTRSDQAVDYVMNSRPDVICMRRWIETPPGRTKFFIDAARFIDHDERFQGDPRFNEQYVEVGGFPAYSDDPSKHLIAFYVNRQSREAKVITEALRRGLLQVDGALLD